jgi:hypothetical protein
MIVVLTPAERKLAEYLGLARKKHHEETRPNKITLYGHLTPEDYLDTLTRSFAAEIAFCKAMNLFPCTEVVDKANRDATLHDGRGVDVKSTANPRGPVCLKKKERMVLTDLYVQVLTHRHHEGVYTLTGWIPCKEAIVDRFFQDVPNPYWAVPQTHLRPMETL